MKKRGKKLLSLALSLAMLGAYAPQTVFADPTPAPPPVKEINLNVKQTDGNYKIAGIESPIGKGNYKEPKAYVYLGNYSENDKSSPIKWRVLDAEKTNSYDSDNNNEDGMLLFSENVLGYSGSNNFQFDSTNASNDYQKSDLKKYCNALLSGGEITLNSNSDKKTVTSIFSDAEKAAVMETNRPLDEEFNSNENRVNKYGYDWKGSVLDKDYLFPLSATELAKYVGSADGAQGLAKVDFGNSGRRYWLRSPNADYGNNVGYVNLDGAVYYDIASIGRRG